MTETARHAAVTLAAGVRLAVDAITVEVTTALQRAGVRPILLKGPSVAQWLYDVAEPRYYVDVDLLVKPDGVPAAEAVLSALGFQLLALDAIPGDRPRHARTWLRGNAEPPVDLHSMLIGASVSAAEAWSTLSAETEEARLGDCTVEVLAPPARAMHLALHAAQHGIEYGTPLEDLSRAIEQLPFTTWTSAAAVASELGATAAFAAGLRLIPAGEELARKLALPDLMSGETALRARTPPDMALGFEWLAQTPSIRAKAALALRKLFPPPSFMRSWSQLARRGRIGLGASYAWRPAWLLLHAPAGYIAWRRACRTVRRHRAL